MKQCRMCGECHEDKDMHRVVLMLYAGEVDICERCLFKVLGVEEEK